MSKKIMAKKGKCVRLKPDYPGVVCRWARAIQEEQLAYGVLDILFTVKYEKAKIRLEASIELLELMAEEAKRCGV